MVIDTIAIPSGRDVRVYCLSFHVTVPTLLEFLQCLYPRLLFLVGMTSPIYSQIQQSQNHN